MKNRLHGNRQKTSAATARQRIPVTVITGYLGAGKTTLLRNLLEHAQREKIRLAVVMNEFGEVGIDGKVVRGKNVQLVELSGGCVCCSMSGEFEAALKELVAKAKPGHIVIETTGVAEPDAIVVDLRGLPGVRLDAVVTVADADSLARFPSLGRTGRMQLEMADLVLLNKTDLVNEKQVEEVKENVREINSRASIVECVRCSVRPEMVLGVNAPAKKISVEARHATEKMDFFVLEAKKILGVKGFEKFVAAIPKSVYRAKGFVKLKKGGKAKTFLWNFAAGRSELEEWPRKQETKMVFIGENIEKRRKKIVQALR